MFLTKREALLIVVPCAWWFETWKMAWWRHQMETVSALLAFVRGIHRSPVNSPHKGQSTRSFDVFFYLLLNKWMSKQSWRRWLETPSRSLWCNCNGKGEPGFARFESRHYDDVIMTMMASQITSLTVVYSIVYSDADQRKHQSSASLFFVRGIHRDRWIPRTKGQLRGKCFHLMTSLCKFRIGSMNCSCPQGPCF